MSFPILKHRTAMAFVSASLLLCVMMALLSAHGCGRPHVRLDKRDLERSYRATYMATPNNVGRWAHLWENGSWIVALPADLQNEPQMRDWRRRIIDGVGSYFQDTLSAGELWSLRDGLARQMTLDFSHSPDPLGQTQFLEKGDKTEWFAKVQLPLRNAPWSSVIGMDIPNLPLPSDVNESLAVAQLQALDATGLFEWVEPNLASIAQQNNDTETPVTPRPPEWNLEGIDPSRNRIRQIFTRINWHKLQDYIATQQQNRPELQKAEIPVAVIDTGIDYQHPELVNRMLKNPLEVEGNGIDDDRNGVVDDVFGFDATVPRGRSAESVASPGAADIGGPGAACPDPRDSPEGTSCGHGTHVAGIIAAQVGGLASLGLCDTCKLYSIRASQRCQYPDTALRGGVCVPPRSGLSSVPSQTEPFVANGKILDFDQVVGLNYLLRFVNPDTGKLRVFIVNMSLGKYVYNRTMASVLDKLEANGVLIVAAAGNDNTETPMFPAAYASTVSVCATSEDSGTVPLASQNLESYVNIPTQDPTRGIYAKTDFSNFGDWVDICAPGTKILSTYPGGKIAALSGTSQASPLVAGAAGFLWSVLIGQGQLDPTRVETNRSIRGRLQRYADPRGIYDPNLMMNRGYGDTIGGVPNYLLGAGMLDMYGAFLTQENGATPSFVADEKQVGASNQLRSGCIASTIAGSKAPRWTFAAALTTMPFVMVQFLIALGLLRYWRRMRAG